MVEACFVLSRIGFDDINTRSQGAQMKVRYSANRYAMDFLLCAEADGKERNLIASMLKKYTEGREDDEAFPWLAQHCLW